MTGSTSGPGPGPGESGAPDGSGEDEAWRAIVSNYGERATLDETAAPSDAEESTGPTEPAADAPGGAADRLPPGDPARLRRLFEPLNHPPPRHDAPSGAPDDDLAKAPDAPYVPPLPSPVPPTTAPRRAAWIGLLGSPTFLLLSLLVGIELPQLLVVMIVGAFVGGFLYLVATMPRGPRDPGDDGARV